jgi:hypothetical protein
LAGVFHIPEKRVTGFGCSREVPAGTTQQFDPYIAILRIGKIG